MFKMTEIVRALIRNKHLSQFHKQINQNFIIKFFVTIEFGDKKNEDD